MVFNGSVQRRLDKCTFDKCKCTNSVLTWSLCVPDTHCYTFTMLDSYGDGICCGGAANNTMLVIMV